MTKTRIALIQMKMSSDQKKNMGSAIRKIKEAYKKRQKLCVYRNYFYQIIFANKKNIPILTWLKKFLEELLIFFVH